LTVGQFRIGEFLIKPIAEYAMLGQFEEIPSQHFVPRRR
jgi:hypothetical protein